MLQRDYFMKMTEMLSVALTKVLFNKENKNYENSLKEIETASKTIVGIDLNLINMLGIEDILKLLKTSDVYAGRCLITAELLKEYANILELKNNSNKNLYLKSLYLYIEALLTKELPTPEDYYSKVNQLIIKLQDLEFPFDLKYKLFEYYEINNQYSKAEDILFELLEENSNIIHDKAILFYKRLQRKTNEELNIGNLSREEVDESLDEVLKLKDL